ncbi:MAG: serine protein kinase RIO, partial [Candidatus Nanohaloarchaea archaeon]
YMELFDSSEARKNVENVLDRETMEALYDLSGDGHFDLLHGFVKDGKESKVAVAERGEGEEREFLAVKLYVVGASNYDSMQKYLTGDPRFEGVGRDKRSVVFNWCRKEYRNLERARDLDIPAPEPVASEKNVLLMEFLGKDYTPAPRLQDVDLENPGTAFERLKDYMERLWNDANLVHGDLSSYNVLLWEQRLHLIDFSQAVLESHPLSEQLLERDVENLADHFERSYGMDLDRDQILEQIIGGETS